MRVPTLFASLATLLALMAATSTAGAAIAGGEANGVSSAERKADVERFDRFIDDALHSSDLRLRVLLGIMPDLRSDDVSGRAPGWTSTPIDELAESARGSTDPMVLALLIEPCSNDRPRPRPSCDGVDLARRWTIAETQNQLAWLTLSAALRARGDVTGSRTAFERAASASLWHEYVDDGARVIAAAVPKAFGSPVRLAMLRWAQSIASAQLTPFSGVGALNFHCNDPTLRAACARIVDTIARDAGTLFASKIAIMIAPKAGTDVATIASRQRAYDALQGAWVEDVPRDADAPMNEAEIARELDAREACIRGGELAFLRATLAASGLTEVASAERYRRYVTTRMEEAKAEPPDR